jgi:hypothetical protein
MAPEQNIPEIVVWVRDSMYQEALLCDLIVVRRILGLRMDLREKIRKKM